MPKMTSKSTFNSLYEIRKGCQTMMRQNVNSFNSLYEILGKEIEWKDFPLLLFQFSL